MSAHKDPPKWNLCGSQGCGFHGRAVVRVHVQEDCIRDTSLFHELIRFGLIVFQLRIVEGLGAIETVRVGLGISVPDRHCCQFPMNSGPADHSMSRDRAVAAGPFERVPESLD